MGYHTFERKDACKFFNELHLPKAQIPRADQNDLILVACLFNWRLQDLEKDVQPDDRE
jgi:hypothetical protein